MALQEIVRTEDVVECLDDRIHTSSDHPSLGIIAGETYPYVLDAIELQVCSPAEKLALALTLTSPSATNPIVLKDDIATYYPQSDLGKIKDSVDAVVDLPPTGNTVGDLRPVISIGAIYRWTGLAWIVFIKTGTIDHTQLFNQDGDPNFLHISASELSSLIAQSHSHLNKTILDAIVSLGSGIVIADSERIRLPSSDEKAALSGSVSSPSATNRYVTNIDPRLNTIRNPYITFGPDLSGATFTGSDITSFNAALASIATGGSIDYINSLEILPSPTPTYYDLNVSDFIDTIVWNDPKPLLWEALACRQSIFILSPQPSSSSTKAVWIAAESGQVTVRGMTFQLGTNNIVGCQIDRDNTVFENCTFTTSSGVSGTIAVQINGNGIRLKSCVFTGNIAQAIIISGDYCSIDDCRFILSNNLYSAINVIGSNAQITSCDISQGIVSVGSSSRDTIFDKVIMSAMTSFVDTGVNTRWLGGISQDYQQAYIGRSRTVGPVNSHADFRGSSETPFLAAMADPYTSEIHVLEGSYTFTSPVTVVSGKSLKTVKKNSVFINGGSCFILNNSTKLYGFNISVAGVSGISLSSVSDVEISGCVFTMNGPDTPTNYAVSASSVTDVTISHCQFFGTRAIRLTGDVRSKISHNTFATSIYSLVSDPTSMDLYYGDNTEEGSVPSLSGSNLIVYGNHFFGSLPSKLGTQTSLWIGNYPPSADNRNGIDTITMATAGFLRPILTSGSYLSSFLGTASLAFIETGLSTIVTLPIFIGALLDRTHGYTVTLKWTAAVFSGSVRWQVTTVFRDRSSLVSDLGTANVQTVLSPRTHLTVNQEESITIPFTSSDYGYILGVDPSHVSLMIQRLGDDPTDTLPGIAYLTEVSITFARN